MVCWISLIFVREMPNCLPFSNGGNCFRTLCKILVILNIKSNASIFSKLNDVLNRSDTIDHSLNIAYRNVKIHFNPWNDCVRKRTSRSIANAIMSTNSNILYEKLTDWTEVTTKWMETNCPTYVCDLIIIDRQSLSYVLLIDIFLERKQSMVYALNTASTHKIRKYLII